MVAATPDTKVFFLLDTPTGTRFLVDTGACRSLYPKAMLREVQSRGGKERLIAANGSIIPTYGTMCLQVSVGGHRLSWKFVVAEVVLPILGADFLAHYDLLVDVRRHRLVDATTLTTTPISAAPSSLATHITFAPDDYSTLLAQYSDVFKPELRQQPHVPSRHGVVHHIKTTGPPVFAKFRRLAPAKLSAAKKVFTEMESMGICQKASSPWSSPLHIVTKKDGSLRPCGDYRRLNMITEADHYPLPNISDVTSYLHGASFFSKLDLLKGYFQVPMHEEDVPKTAITTPFGTYTFNYSCFGLRNAGATFQRLMDGILGDLPFCVCYVDDILVFSSSKKDHLQHLQVVLDRLQQNGLVVKYDKCTFGAQEVEFLGHHLSARGVAPLPVKVEAVKEFPTPSTVKNLQEFLGMVNFYHRFIPHVAAILAPLYEALKGKPKKLLWGPHQEEAFNKAKDSLAAASLLVFPSHNASLQLTTDASNVAVGAVLEQLVHGQPYPIAFFSRKLSGAESRYSTFDRELLAVYLAVRHFRHMIEGASFHIFTDHLPLVHAFTKQTDPCSNRQQRHLSTISEFNCAIRHLPGKNNPVADALSRNAISLVQMGIDFHDLAEKQRADPEYQACRTSFTSLQWMDLPLQDSQTSILCDTSTGRPRPWVPTVYRRSIFDMVHGLSHPSRRATANLLKKKFIWHGIAKDAKEWARTCLACQRAKVYRHTESGIGSFQQPKRRFSHIHVDVVGPLPPSEGYRYLFTVVDRSTRWPEAVPMKDATTDSCVSALLSHWIARFGVPDDITSDRGSTFTSHIWTSLAQLLGSTVHHTTSYNPESNGMVERFHRTLKAALMSRCTSSEWSTQLPWVLLGLRSCPRESSEVSAAEMVYGDPLQVPADFFTPSLPEGDLQALRQTVHKFGPCKQTYKDTRTRYVPQDLNTASHVFIRIDSHRTPLSPPYSGPYKVLQRRPKAFKLDLKNKHDWISIDRLKPAYLLEDDQPTIKLSRAGRPLRKNKVFS